MARPRRDPVLALAMALFFVGLLALGAVFVLSAEGRRAAPWLLGVVFVLLPGGLLLGVGRTFALSRRRADTRADTPADNRTDSPADGPSPAGDPA